MPSPPVPPDVDEFLRRANPGVVATIRPDGELHTAATWYEWQDDGTVLLNMDASRKRLGHMRQDPRVALTVLDEEDWGRHISLLGRIVELAEDLELRDIDRLALRYTGQPFRTRDRRRFSAWLRVDAWHGWDGPGPWPGSRE